MEDPMGFERHAIPSAKTPVRTKPDGAARRKTEPVVTPLREADASREADTLRLARQMRSEWRKERYSRLAGH
jgi:hypothetical protein